MKAFFAKGFNISQIEEHGLVQEVEKIRVQMTRITN